MVVLRVCHANMYLLVDQIVDAWDMASQSGMLRVRQ